MFFIHAADRCVIIGDFARRLSPEIVDLDKSWNATGWCRPIDEFSATFFPQEYSRRSRTKAFSNSTSRDN